MHAKARQGERPRKERQSETSKCVSMESVACSDVLACRYTATSNFGSLVLAANPDVDYPYLQARAFRVRKIKESPWKRCADETEPLVDHTPHVRDNPQMQYQEIVADHPIGIMLLARPRQNVCGEDPDSAINSASSKLKENLPPPATPTP